MSFTHSFNFFSLQNQTCCVRHFNHSKFEIHYFNLLSLPQMISVSPLLFFLYPLILLLLHFQQDWYQQLFHMYLQLKLGSIQLGLINQTILTLYSVMYSVLFTHESVSLISLYYPFHHWRNHDYPISSTLIFMNQFIALHYIYHVAIEDQYLKHPVDQILDITLTFD